MKHELTTEQLKEIHYNGSDITKSMIEELFPELFKKLKVGEWVYDHINKVFQRVLEINGNKANLTQQSWTYTKQLRLATPLEIESHLIKLAKKKGFKEGASCHWDDESNITHHNLRGGFNYNEESDSLNIGHRIIYMEGKWATILPSTIEVTLEEARNEVAKAKGLDASLIKIII